MSSLKDFFLSLNVFESSADDDQIQDARQRRIYIIASRIYFIILISILIIVGIVSSLVRQITIVTVQNPSIDQFMHLPYDANCPCSRSSIPYEEFISIEVGFHQICSSDFISDRWIKTISSGANSTYFDPQDFRTYGSAQFQALADFCRLSATTAQQEINSYISNSLFSSQVVFPDVLLIQITIFIAQLRMKMLNDFEAQLQLIRKMTMGNRLISGLQTNNIQIYENIGNSLMRIYPYPIQYQDSNGSICDCTLVVDCVAVSGIFNSFNVPTQFDLDNDFTWMRVPGISSGCLPVNSILLSTLECFYNQTCVDQLVEYFSTTERFTAMNSNESSRFNSNSMVQSLLNNLMIEYWIENVSYSAYYSQCAAIACIYTKSERNSFVFVLTQLISILGGMKILLGFIIPFPIRSMQRLRNADQSPQTSQNMSLFQMKTIVLKFLLELNWYKHHPSNDRQIRYQRYATRVYILLVLSSLIIMTFYISLSKTVYQQTFVNPAQDQYQELQQTFSNNLSCPCTSFSASYSSFIEIQPHYHQLCSSEFVSSRWIDYLSMNLFWNNTLLPWDYRILSSSLFISLAMFCTESQRTIDSSLLIFYQREFISSQVVSEEVFQSQIQSFIVEWQSSTVNQFLQTIELIQAITHGNQLMNDINFDYPTNNTSTETILKPRTFSNCSCALFPSCRTNMAIYQYDLYSNNISELLLIPNFFLSCLPIEGLLASTLECFYNRSCMVEIDKYIYQSLGETFSFSPLDENLNSPIETIESIINRIMVDEWLANISFTSYYDKCAPQSCTYEYTGRQSLFSVITSTIGVFGGLSLAFEILVLIILRLIEKIITIRISRFNLISLVKTMFNCGDEQRMIKQLHCILVVMSLSTLYIFTTFTPELVTVKIKNPSVKTYEGLLIRFPQSLQCPCSHISIKYGSLFSITPDFHQVCSSDFISDRWIVYLYGTDDPIDRYLPMDFLYSASAQFQLLASLCRLSQKTVDDSLINLSTGDFINPNLLSMNLLQQRTSIIINEFLTSISKSFLSTLSLIRATTRANMIMTTLSTNWVITIPSFTNNKSKVHTIPLVYQDCSCALSSKCVQSSRNMYAGCYPLEALLQATFECLYDQQCIDPTDNFQAMNISQPTHFDINTTIESIVNEFMIERFSIETSYLNYFTQCAPSSCQYSYIENKNIIDGLTNLISLYGGVMVICRAVAVLIIKLLQRRIRKVQPISN